MAFLEQMELGRLVKDKGIIELVNAFKEITKKNKKVALLLVGPFEKRDSRIQAGLLN